MACPFRCIYCNQYVISGQQQMPSDSEIINTIEQHLATFPKEAEVELGFFGGTFTGLPLEEQERLLALVRTYIIYNNIRSIRLSTRPDYISQENIDLLCRYGVGTVELGVQSLDDEVLKQVHRGYTSEAVVRAAEIIKAAGLELGMQMMVGLPGDTPQKSLQTAQRIIDLGAKNTRIYPTLVVSGTVLEKLYRQGNYQPLSIEEAVRWVAPILKLFEENDVTILRVGLHPTEGFISGTDYLAGPFHVSFKELVMTEIFRQEFFESDRRLELFDAADSARSSGSGNRSLVVRVAPGKRNAAIGYKASNLHLFRKLYQQVSIVEEDSLSHYGFTFVNPSEIQN
ncbi:MAG: radical SAM protein [Bacteroidales bacterium]|nr:radical SAM protein [Bacteroidales bacterium]